MLDNLYSYGARCYNRLLIAATIGMQYDRSTRRITPLVLLMGFTSLPVVSQTTVDTPDHTYKLLGALIALVGVILAHVLVPAMREYFRSKRSINRYIRFIKVTIENSHKHYGECNSVNFVKRLVFKNDLEHVWWPVLERIGVVPGVFLSLNDAAKKYNRQNFNAQDPGNTYIPFLSYVGMSTTEMDHDHPLWTMDKTLIAPISDYLNSQRQIENTLERIYNQEYLSMARSTNSERRKQWLRAFHNTVYDLAEHYEKILNLEKALIPHLK